MFKVKPKCEVCLANEAKAFAHFAQGNDLEIRGWYFVCDCTDEVEHYYIQFDRFFNSPRVTVDAFAQLSEKSWVDWTDFMKMMSRFRDATDSFGSF